MREYETNKYLHKVTDHPFTTDNIYTGTPDSFEDVNPQQEKTLYREEKTPNTFKNWKSFTDRIIANFFKSKAEVNKERREKRREKMKQKKKVEI